VDLKRFEPTRRRERRPTILFASALDEPRKGLGVLVKGFEILLQWEPRARLWLSGPGEGASVLSETPPDVRGRITKLPLGDPAAQGKRYARAWVCALPAIHEAFGLVVVESFACGTPVVASNGGALPELVTPETGALCDPDDPVSVADALANAISLSRRRDIVDACRAVAEPYDWETGVAPVIETIYEDR
jgi:glycosyltransferase involved in cell wall biosynthesis